MNRLNKLVAGTLLVASTLSLASCGAASKGYDLWKNSLIETNEALPESLRMKLSFKGANYVNVKVEEDSVFYYKAEYNATLKDKSQDLIAFFTWVENTEQIIPSTGAEYTTLYEKVSTNSMYGTVGRC